MAPVTRRRSNMHNLATEEAQVASPVSQKIETSDVPLEEPAKKRGKRKSAGAAQQDQGDEHAAQDIKLITPRRQKLSVRTVEEKTAGGGRKKRIEAEMPSSTSKPVRSSPVPDSYDESDDAIEIEPASASRQLEEEASHQLASQSLDPDPTPQPKPKSKHVVFGDDDEVDNFVMAGAEIEKEPKEAQEEAGSDNEEEDDDDDDAPEAVSTQAAAKERLKSSKAATEAAEKHVASLKRKRQERDNFFKQQAEKRKRTLPKERGRSQSPDSDDHGENVAAEGGEKAMATTGRRRADKHKLPAMLPAEFLADSSSESEDDETVLKKVIKKPKKINFDTAAAAATAGEGKKHPRDQIVGTTRYRVLAEHDGHQNLAPKVNRGSRIAKNILLKRGRKGAAPNAKKGFFVKR